MNNNSKAPQLPHRRKETVKTYPVLGAKQIKDVIEKKCGNVYIAERQGAGKHQVFILPEAFQEFKNIISYGRRSPMNRLEQKYVGYGHFFTDEDQAMMVVISHFIPILTTNRSTVSASNLGPNGEMNPGLDFLEYHREEYQAYERQLNIDAFGYLVDPFIEYGGSNFVLEGHTHPDLGAFWSHTDKISGAARAASLPICIFVCDPVRKEMLGCIGKDFEGAEVIAYDRQIGETPVSCANDELIELANVCLRKRGYHGRVQSRIRHDGKLMIKMKLLAPKLRKDKR